MTVYTNAHDQKGRKLPFNARSHADISDKMINGYDLLPAAIRRAYALGPLDVSAQNAVGAWPKFKQRGGTEAQFVALIERKFAEHLANVVEPWPGDYPTDIQPLKG